MPIRDILVDMDGVLAGFDQAVSQQAGVPIGTLSRKEIRQFSSKPGFFANLPMMWDAPLLWKYLHVHTECNIYICSATGDSEPERVFREKNIWLDFFTYPYNPARRLFVHKSEDKRLFASPDALLIDDRTKAMDPFLAKGGRGILHTGARSTILELQEILFVANKQYPRRV